MISPDAKADAARSPTFADGMSNGQTRTIGTKHQPTKAPAPPRSRYRGSGATTAQPYAMRIARKSQPTFFIDHDLAPSTTVSGAIIVTDSGPDNNRSPQHHRRGLRPSDSTPATRGGRPDSATAPDVHRSRLHRSTRRVISPARRTSGLA